MITFYRQKSDTRKLPKTESLLRNAKNEFQCRKEGWPKWLCPRKYFKLVKLYVYADGKYFGPFPVANMSQKGNSLISCSYRCNSNMPLPVFLRMHSVWFKWVKRMQDLSTGWLHCDPGPMFKPEYYWLPGWLPQWVRICIVRNDFIYYLLVINLLAYLIVSLIDHFIFYEGRELVFFF